MGGRIGTAVGLMFAFAALASCGSGGSGSTTMTTSPTTGGGGSTPPSHTTGGSMGAAGGAGLAPAACTPASQAGGPYCLTFEGTSFDIHVGQQFKVALVSSDGKNSVLAYWTFAALPAGSFWVNLPQSMVAGVNYYVDYYSDETRDGACEAPTPDGASDHVYRSYDQVVPFDNAKGIIRTVSTDTTHQDFAWVTMHSDPWITDPTHHNTCPQLNSF